MLHNFLMAAREAGYTQADYRSDPEKIAASFIQAVETYEYDGVLVDIDTATLAEAVGVPVDLPDDDPARCREGCLRDLSAVIDLDAPDVGRCPRIQIWLEAVRRLRDYFGDEIAIRGNCDQAPFSLAGMMRSPSLWMMDLLDEEQRENVFRLLDYCTEATGQFIRLMVQTGAHMTANGDSPAGPDMISPEMYRTFALPYERKVVEVAHEGGLPYVLHICGKTDVILDDMVTSGADGLELDYKTDVTKARQALDNRCTFFGNIDPSGVLTLGTPAQVEQATRALLDVFADTPRFVLNAGCAIPAHAPSENIKAMIRTARNF